MNDPRTQFSDSFDHNLDTPFGHNLSRFAPTNGICRNGNDQESLQFRPNLHQQESMDSDDSGVCSPPLWKNSPSPSQPLLNHHRSLSPNSRIQAITRGQRELMELVKNLPESSYELSMKDLVEQRVESTQKPPSNSPNLQRRAAAAKVGRQGSKKNERGMMRIESFEDRGLFLKLVFPFSLKSKKKNNFGSKSNGKVSPKPEAAKGGGGGGGGGGVERDWWKKKFSGSSDSDSSRTSNNSGSTGSSGSGGSSSGRSDGVAAAGRRKNDLLRGCWPFLQSRIRRYVE